MTENNELCFGVVSGRGNLKGCRITILFGFYGATEALGVEVGFIEWLIILFFLIHIFCMCGLPYRLFLRLSNIATVRKQFESQKFLGVSPSNESNLINYVDE